MLVLCFEGEKSKILNGIVKFSDQTEMFAIAEAVNYTVMEFWRLLMIAVASALGPAASL